MSSKKKLAIFGAFLAIFSLILSTHSIILSMNELSLSVPSPILKTLAKALEIVSKPLAACSPSVLNLSSVLLSATHSLTFPKNGFFILSIGSRKAAIIAGIRLFRVRSIPPIVPAKFSVASLYLSCIRNRASIAMSDVIWPSFCNLANCSVVMFAIPSCSAATSLMACFISGKTLIIDNMS